MQDDIIPKVATSDGTVLKVGDVFYYRGRGSESAAVNPVIVRTLDDQIAGLSFVEIMADDGYEDARKQPALYVQIERIEVVQMRGELHQPKLPPEPPPLPKGLLNGLKKKNRRN